MNMGRQVILRLKEQLTAKHAKFVLLKDLADISAEEGIKQDLENLAYPIDIKEENNIVISAISIISFIKKKFHDVDLIVVGKTDVLINFADEKADRDRYKIVRVILVCFLLFIGSITAIINFHSDVDMKQAHKVIYKVITGVETDKLLLLQIPYSLGIGVGMAVFFNNVFSKKINEEPTPLEMEMYTYRQNVDEYIKNNNAETR